MFYASKAKKILDLGRLNILSRLRFTHMAGQSHTDALPQFYRRKLPSSCISFGSAEGKALFAEALHTGHLEGYFGLAAQFRTQDEPAFCGLSTLVMVLNTLEVDPRRVWKGPWRWYHEKMLDCCVPLEMVEKEGITFDQFACLAACNTLNVQATRGDDSAALASFRETVIKSTQSGDQVLIVSYSRRVLGQTGDGHFSPLAGYHPGMDQVLILDTARFKYPPHWVPLPLLFEAIKAIDKGTGLPRGYMVLSKSSVQPLLMFRVSQSLSIPGTDLPRISDFLHTWDSWLLEADNLQGNDMIRAAAKKLYESLRSLASDEYLLTTQVDLRCPESISDEHKCAVDEIVTAMNGLPMLSVIQETLDECMQETDRKNGSPVGRPALLNKECQTLSAPNPGRMEKPCSFATLETAHFISAVLLAWPYPKCVASNGHQLLLHSSVQLSQSSDILQNEMNQLREQLTAVFSLVQRCEACRKC